MQAQPSRRLTCFQARGHTWMTLDESREPPSPELDAHSLSNSESDLYTDALHEREQSLGVKIPVSQQAVMPTTSTESSRAWSPVTQPLKDPFSELSSSGADPIGSLPDFSLSDSITTKADTMAKPTVNVMPTIPESTQEDGDSKIRRLFGRLDVKKNADTSILLGQIPLSSDGSWATDRPEEALAEKPGKHAKENSTIKWTMNWKKLLRRIGSDTSIASRKGTPTSTSIQASPQGTQKPIHGPETLQLHQTALSTTPPGGSVTAGKDPQSHASVGEFPLPQSIISQQQSEQVPFFKDYYSQDDILPGDMVAVLWAYQPRATDEFALERGDMLYVRAVWDDGWGVGTMMDERAEEWEAKRDSGVSSSSGHVQTSPSGEIKAFPLVCVCCPQHWRETIKGS
ncbi:sh3 domain-containing protein [Fusarium mundagurra]|uniref:Sh3 domain-containing protein n=1 Tax=Fusarium mundagurra TaxID=1567541 RepID=A0A8H6DE92_9HYPO|nr:sh3 domain-containing protein [Fusarium mundagurra]